MTRKGEADAIGRSPMPVTATTLAAEIRALGVRTGGTLIVHSSLSRLGWVAGGAQAVVEALFAVAGPDGTVVVPTHSSDLSDPARWQEPPVPESWWPVIRAEMPPFDPATTPTRMMGAIVECFRHADGVLRSDHPRHSFAARGPDAGLITAEHDLADSFGERTPLARCYDLDAQVLLLGVGHANNTSLHLAETRADYTRTRVRQGSPMLVDGRRTWVAYEEVDIDDSDFDTIGVAFAQSGAQTEGPAGAGVAKCMPQRAIVDFAVAWMTANRP